MSWRASVRLAAVQAQYLTQYAVMVTDITLKLGMKLSNATKENGSFGSGLLTQCFRFFFLFLQSRHWSLNVCIALYTQVSKYFCNRPK